ncbi:HAMP domain-containing sensor histidine kinase [Prosthecobacter sp.]|uniref:sensor histidine kinase n=1 Tax=Prosthecobacter sp. TaxID=1965333 RepID=UPI001D89AE40|nr:HAMP domain-containing sensor histidine kinase [Prosthecobacter sp.]MCB1279101.1 HAMP domain-containing histidine kinase [Prosthecobacter sp.]
MSSLIKSWRFGLAFLSFVVVGSLLLLAWLRQREREESNRLFHALAQADAEFVRQMNLPRSERLARDLERLVGEHIEFREAGKGMAENEDTLVIRLDDKNDMLFTRKPVASQLSMRDPATRNALIVFWLVSALVGWLLARERIKRAQSERLAMLGRVATSLAHDIKNPLASIQLHAQLMTPENVEDAKALKLIASESEVIAGLVNQWLHLANPLPPKLAKLDVGECVRAVAQNLEPQAQHAGVSVENSLAGPIWVRGDTQRLSQAFRNILVNGIQAMPRGGRLRIEAENHERMVVIRFTDSGPGFSDAALARGTELFFTEKEGGMGVGLNIVASVVEAHGGRLEMKNDPKGGAVIIVSLPSSDA